MIKIGVNYLGEQIFSGDNGKRERRDVNGNWIGTSWSLLNRKSKMSSDLYKTVNKI
jgi:hypothetical protein